MISGCLFVFPAKSFWRLLNDSECGLCFLAVAHTLSVGKLTAPTGGSTEQQRFNPKVADAKSARAIPD
jgi:hypothetical protein